jgi:spermidine/putrescine transport system permease protein
MLSDRIFKNFAIGSLTIWLSIFALLPILLVFIGSFLTQGEVQFFAWHFTLSNYTELFKSHYFLIFWRSFYLAGITVLLCLILGYPFAYIIAKLPDRIKPLLIFLIILPFWTSSLIRIYAIITIIGTEGYINHLLLWLGIIQQPLQIMFTKTAVLLGLVYSLLPFMVLPLYANLDKFDWRLIDAARDLGANKWHIFIRVIIPITIPGIIAGIMLVLLPAMTMFYIPDILGGAKSLLLGNLIKNQFVEARNWPLGSVVSVMLTALMGLLLIIYWKLTTAKERCELL